MANYAKKKEIFEILEDVMKQKSRKDKIAKLQEYKNLMALRDVLQGTFDERIQWNLPEGTPPYEASKPESYPSTLLKQHLQFKFFVKGLRESERLMPVRRERMFIDMLESVHPKDAEILVSMINKKSPMKGLTVKLVQEAIPDLIPS
jgi:hypothetical protein